MNTTFKTTYADYRLVNGKMKDSYNEEGHGFAIPLDDDGALIGVLRSLKAGAAILQLLIDHPWLQSFKLRITAEAQDTEDGRAYRDITNCVSDVVAMVADMPKDLLAAESRHQFIRTHEQLETALYDADGDFVIYDGVVEQGLLTTINIGVDRSKVAHMFQTGEFSAAEAFKLYLADTASSLNTPTPPKDTPVSTPITHPPEYRLTDGKVLPNEAGVQLRKTHQELEEQMRQLHNTEVGALMLQLFVENPWLQSYTLSMGAESTYDDEDGAYRSVNGRFIDITTVPGSAVPEALVDTNGQLSESDADFALTKRVEAISDFEFIYTALVDRYSYDDFEFVIGRSKIQELIDANDLSGHKAHQQLFQNADAPPFAKDDAES